MGEDAGRRYLTLKAEKGALGGLAVAADSPESCAGGKCLRAGDVSAIVALIKGKSRILFDRRVANDHIYPTSCRDPATDACVPR